jgi:hypothetical protein
MLGFGVGILLRRELRWDDMKCTFSNTNSISNRPLEVFNNVIRPLRLGVSIALAPALDELVLFFQKRLKVKKPVAITVTVVAVNVFGTVVLMSGGILVAALLAGVPLK